MARGLGMVVGNYDQVVETGSRYIRLVGAPPRSRYNEDEFLTELRAYIDQTYGEHYAVDEFQSLDAIFASGNGTGFCMGNIQKLAFRYGKKNGYNKLDLLKILHYGILMLYCHDRDNVVHDETAGEKSDGSTKN